MRYMPAAVLALSVAVPAAAQDAFDLSEYGAFRRALADVDVGNLRAAFELHRCNVAASKKIGKRPVLATIGRPIESEAREAMSACAAEADALDKTMPSQAAAIKAAIVRDNAKVIEEIRNPPTVACAGDIPAAMCWRPWR